MDDEEVLDYLRRHHEDDFPLHFREPDAALRMGRLPEPETLEATWWVFDREPGMDDIYEQAGSLQEMSKLEIHPFQDQDENPRLFLARFEFPKYGESFQYPDAVFMEKARGFVDFLAGFPMECVEMLGVVGEVSTKKGDVAVLPGDNRPAPPVPKKFFEGFPEDKILLNTMFLTTEQCKVLVNSLPGEPEPKNLHWWVRVNLVEGEGKTFPVPGEFLALAARLMPDKPWGKQKSSPFLYSGNWMDTVYYTRAKITEVLDPTDETPYPRYKVQWRGKEIAAKPSDFAVYQVGDRVTIVKDVATEKASETWKDDDLKEFGDNWQIAPVTFYGLGYEED